MNSAAQFIAELSLISLPNVFNPYADRCKAHDGPSSATIRRANLQLYLDAAIQSGTDHVWLGRDCGYRGARRTGIALTDEHHLPALERHFGISGLRKATDGQLQKERTATEVWKIIAETNVRVFLWNVFPFHPYEPQSSFSNRCHSRSEFDQCRELLTALLRLLNPRNVVTLGADAHRAVTSIGLSAQKVRHPSYGGQYEFADGVRRLSEKL